MIATLEVQGRKDRAIMQLIQQIINPGEWLPREWVPISHRYFIQRTVINAYVENSFPKNI